MKVVFSKDLKVGDVVWDMPKKSIGVCFKVAKIVNDIIMFELLSEEGYPYKPNVDGLYSFNTAPNCEWYILELSIVEQEFLF